MRDAVRWAIAIALAAVVIGLIAYARGDKHHRGDDIGSHGLAPSLSSARS